MKFRVMIEILQILPVQKMMLLGRISEEIKIKLRQQTISINRCSLYFWLNSKICRYGPRRGFVNNQ